MIKKIALAAVLMAAPLTANAALVNGAINITGDLNGPLSDFASGDLGTDDIVFASAGVIGATTGDFAGVVGPATMFDIDLDALATNVWSVGGFTFSLTGVQSLITIGSFSILEGVGVITGNGYDATNAFLNFSSNGSSTLASFSTTTSAVPVPASGLLLLGALGAAAVARRKSKAA